MQRTLNFDAPPSRRTDPETSRLAAEKHAPRANANRATILEELARRDGQTGYELAAATGLKQQEPNRRLPELERAGLVRRGDMRVCRVGGNMALTWWRT